jgi:hypothetical protein
VQTGRFARSGYVRRSRQGRVVLCTWDWRRKVGAKGAHGWSRCDLAPSKNPKVDRDPLSVLSAITAARVLRKRGERRGVVWRSRETWLWRDQTRKRRQTANQLLSESGVTPSSLALEDTRALIQSGHSVLLPKLGTAVLRQPMHRVLAFLAIGAPTERKGWVGGHESLSGCNMHHAPQPPPTALPIWPSSLWRNQQSSIRRPCSGGSSLTTWHSHPRPQLGPRPLEPRSVLAG